MVHHFNQQLNQKGRSEKGMSKSSQNQWHAIERIIQNLDADSLTEAQFVDLCAALQVRDTEVIGWGLDTLSSYGMLDS